MSPSRLVTVAARELVATAVTKGFLIGVVLMPLLLGALALAVPALIRPPPARGSVAVIDRTGRILPSLSERISPDSPIGSRIDQASAAAFLRIEPLPADADVKRETAALREPSPAADGRLALVVLPEGALDGEQPFELYASPRLDVLLQLELTTRVGDAIVDSRIRTSGQDAAEVRKLVARPPHVAKTVTAAGEETTNALAAVLLPGGFMFLLWMATFTAGQFLLTSLVEEKSMRVMEVLLSAVSPLELLAGKILGQAAVALFVLGVYAALGVGALSHLSLLYVLRWEAVLLSLYFFVVAFLLVASVMAAVGSVVDDLRSAQSLLGPIMGVMMLPALLWLPISNAPSSTFAVVSSFVPPVGPFVTVLRLAGCEPPPFGQLAASMAAGAASVVLFVWAAGKIFQIGVLRYGKAPTLGTMLRWASGRSRRGNE